MILFTADWHIKLGQKNVPMPWACTRYEMFFEQVHDLEKAVDLHIIGGDLFDRVPNIAVVRNYTTDHRSDTSPSAGWSWKALHRATFSMRRALSPWVAICGASRQALLKWKKCANTFVMASSWGWYYRYLKKLKLLVEFSLKNYQLF